MMINTRADLDAMRGTDQWPTVLQMLAGATIEWRNTAEEGLAPTWEPVEDATTLGRLGMTLAELQAELAAAGIAMDPPAPPPIVEPPPAVPTFLARDLLDLLTDDDFVKIETAKAGNVSLRRLWDSLLGQGDAPIRATADRFLAGWAGLSAAVGQARAAEIAEELGISSVIA